MSYEAELPGMKVSREQLRIISFRYHFASQFVEGKRVLEVGCGPGLGLGYLSRKAQRVIGSDYAEDNLRLAQQHYKGSVGLTLLDAHQLPFRDNCFGVVVAMAVAIYLQLDSFFSECCRVLEPGGTLVFCIPNQDQSGFQPSALSRNYFSVPELSGKMKRYFDARFYGAFPVAKEPPLAVRRGTVVFKIGNALMLVPKCREISGFLSRLLHRSLILKEEIEEGIAADIKAEPIPGDCPNLQYRVLYAVGTR